jgi:hypothetical protein
VNYTYKGKVMVVQKRILSYLITFTFAASLVASNLVYATGNPAETHDSTSPTRRVEDMNYSYLNLNFNKTNIAHTETCQSCQKNVDEVVVHEKKVVKDGHHYRKHHRHEHKHHHKHGHKHHHHSHR